MLRFILSERSVRDLNFRKYIYAEKRGEEKMEEAPFPRIPQVVIMNIKGNSEGKMSRVNQSCDLR